MLNIAQGATASANGAHFSVWSKHASHLDLCLFDAEGREQIAQLPMRRGQDDNHSVFVDGIKPGARYGFRASGIYSPDHGLWFDPNKLLVDPYAKQLDRPFQYDPRLSVFGFDTQDLVPKSVLTECQPANIQKPIFDRSGLIYEIAVRPFTMLHPDVPPEQRGTISALAHPSIIAHLKKIGVSAVELMPIVAWLDERHLAPLGLVNSWGYNPIAFMALEPRLAPGGIAELRDTVKTLHDNGIGVILDLVFNHSGESDRYGATVSMRGLDNLTYYRHVPDQPGVLINDAGCGNILACDHPTVEALVIDSLRHFVSTTGVDGFRFDLAPILGRSIHGFSPDAPLLRTMQTDPLLSDRILISEPWDIGPGGYQLGNFPQKFLEWNDRARDDLRIYWRGDSYMTGKLATVLAGSSDIFQRHGANETRTVNFLAAHDGFSLLDMVSYQHKHNEANGEDNRDGHNENHSWNNGIEGETDDPAIIAARKRDVMALLSTLFATRGAIMLTAGDEFGRTQRGNNNAYAQDNAITWLNWAEADVELTEHVALLADLRKRFSVFSQASFFTGQDQDVEWFSVSGYPMTVQDWNDPDGKSLIMRLKTYDRELETDIQLTIAFNRSAETLDVHLPSDGKQMWVDALTHHALDPFVLPRRSVTFAYEVDVL